METVTMKKCSVQTDRGMTLCLVEMCNPADACAIGMRGNLGPDIYEWVIIPENEAEWDRELNPFQLTTELRSLSRFAVSVREALCHEQPRCQHDWWWSYHVRKQVPRHGHNVVTIVFGPEQTMRTLVAAGNVPIGHQFIPE